MSCRNAMSDISTRHSISLTKASASIYILLVSSYLILTQHLQHLARLLSQIIKKPLDACYILLIFGL